MRWPRRCHRKAAPEVPTEDEVRKARVDAERRLRETWDRWPVVHDVSAGLRRARQESGPDPFLDELEQAMRKRRKRHREA
jgi:hypothetical protein